MLSGEAHYLKSSHMPGGFLSPTLWPVMCQANDTHSKLEADLITTGLARNTMGGRG